MWASALLGLAFWNAMRVRKGAIAHTTTLDHATIREARNLAIEVSSKLTCEFGNLQTCERCCEPISSVCIDASSLSRAEARGMFGLADLPLFPRTPGVQYLEVNGGHDGEANEGN